MEKKKQKKKKRLNKFSLNSQSFFSCWSCNFVHWVDDNNILLLVWLKHLAARSLIHSLAQSNNH